MEFPAFRDMSVLYITVEVGFVDGISAATMPMGTPTSIIPLLSSSPIIPTVFMSFM